MATPQYINDESFEPTREPRDRLRVSIERERDRCRVIYEGNSSQLLESAAAEPQMLDFPPCGQRTGRDEYGDRFQSFRRADGTVRLIRVVRETAAHGFSGRRWGRASGAERLESASAAVQAALAQIQEGRS